MLFKEDCNLNSDAGLPPVKPEWHTPVTIVLEIAQHTLSKAGGDGDSCDSTHGHS
jgi:hypothetical protein